LDVSLSPKEEKTAQADRDEGMMLLNVFGPLAQPDPATGQVIVDKTTLIRIVGDKLGIDRRDLAQLIPSAFQQQQAQLEQQQGVAGMASAQAGQPRPDMVPGPAGAAQLSQATNAGTIPPEVLAAAAGNIPGSPEAAGTVSESLGNKGPTGPAG
jgi:hypothetical protein